MRKESDYCCDLAGSASGLTSDAGAGAGFGEDAAEAEQHEGATAEEGDAEQQVCPEEEGAHPEQEAGAGGFGAETPAVLEPRPSF
jgi:hypothetical protein